MNRRTLAIGGIAVLVATAAGWLSLRPVPVLRHQVQRHAVIEEVIGTGTLEARVSATVGSKIAGRVATMTVDDGDVVETGQVVARLDDADMLLQVEMARADEAAAHAAVERAQADHNRAQVVVEAAKREHERDLELVRRQVVSQVEADTSLDTLRVAEASVVAVGHGVAEATRRRLAATQALKYHEARLAETVIRAPFAGLIVRRYREAGDVVVPGSPMLGLVATDNMEVHAWIDETVMARLHVGQPARIRFRSAPNVDITATVARLSREVDRETREFIVDVRLQQLPGTWAVGQRADVFIEVARAADAVAVPVAFVRHTPEGVGVFVDIDGTAQWRPLTIGCRGREFFEATAGVSAGDTLLARATPAHRALTDGARVAAP